ncbi:MAG: ABC transporter permease [archaeon]
MNKEIFRLVISYIIHRKTRILLTTLGIVIGIAAIVSLFSLGQGLENAITAQFSTMGSNRLMVASKGLQGPPIGTQGLTTDDEDVLKGDSDFEYVSGILWLLGKIEYNKETSYRNIQAINPENVDKEFKDMARSFYKGKGLGGSGKYSAVIGYRLAKDEFDKEIKVNSKIYIDDIPFKVVGIVEEQGDQTEDYMIRIPIEAGREVFNKPKEVNVITAVVKDGVDIERAKERATKLLEKHRGEEDFQVISPKEIQEQISSILGIVRSVLIGIAAISLLVGAIGIMNSMYTSVLERTRDIGIMKSVGARNSDILSLFLIESGIIGFIGGLIGIVIGSLLAFSVQFGATQAGFTLLKVTIDYKVMLFGLGFAFLLGMFSGILPAYRAAKLKPVDALRYE